METLDYKEYNDLLNDETKKNLEIIQAGGLPENLLNKMSLDINIYLNEVENEQTVNKLELKRDNIN